MEALGVDFGGVVTDQVVNDNTETSFFSDNFLSTTAVPCVFEVLRRLVIERFGEQVYIVSMCGPNIRRKTLLWMQHHRFYERTGILSQHVRFCRTHAGKTPICQELNVTHFIDDRLEVLSHMSTVANKFLFQGRITEISPFAEHLQKVRQVSSWQQIAEELL